MAALKNHAIIYPAGGLSIKYIAINCCHKSPFFSMFHGL